MPKPTWWSRAHTSLSHHLHTPPTDILFGKHTPGPSSRMLYHALRLACITVSSFKTWKAVVDSGDRSLAKRYMFLWFLTLAGLSIEPIADSVLRPWIPMYDGIKIIVAGWLLLAHFYLTKPGEEYDSQHGWRVEEQSHHHTQTAHHWASSSSDPSYLATTKQTSQTQQHAFQPANRMSASTTAGLDFGRFKRDLVKRQTSGSINSATDIALSASTSRARRPNPPGLYQTTSAPTLNNPFEISARSPADTRDISSLSMGAALSNRRSLSGLEPYEFGSGTTSRKRPLSVMSSIVHNPRSISRQGSRRNKLDSISTIDRELTRPDTSASRMKKRLKQLFEDERATEAEAVPERSESLARTKALEVMTEQEYSQRTSMSQPNRFPRPKPSGRNRKELLPHSTSSLPKVTSRRQNSHGSRQHAVPSLEDTGTHPKSRIEPVSASLESRMKNVRSWLKERNPSMISPPLSAKSEFSNRLTDADGARLATLARIDIMSDSHAEHNPTIIAKRKAHTQLLPRTSPKRQAQGRRPRYEVMNGEDAMVYPALNDTAAYVHHSQRPELLQPTRRELNRGSIGHSIVQSPDPLRDQPTTDPFFPPVNWSRFQKRSSSNNSIPPPVPPPKNTKASSTTATATVPTSAFTFRMTTNKSVNPFITNSFVGDNDDNAIISPLIKLRQSQLKQRQQEDFLGIKREDNPAAARRLEEEGGLAFNETLEAWQKEDDDVLARNAAREAAEAEAKDRNQGQGRVQNDSFISSDSSKGSLDTSSAKYNKLSKQTSSTSLLRTVEFNGESSRRPAPDLQSKKQIQDSTASRAHYKDDGVNYAVATSTPPSVRHTSSIQTLSSSFGRGASRLSKSVSYTSTPDSASSRRQKHPGLYTPSKKKPTFDPLSLLSDPQPPQSPHQSTPITMSRYIQLSTLSDDDV